MHGAIHAEVLYACLLPLFLCGATTGSIKLAYEYETGPTQ